MCGSEQIEAGKEEGNPAYGVCVGAGVAVFVVRGCSVPADVGVVEGVAVLVVCGWVPSGDALGNGVTVAVGTGVVCSGVTVAVGSGPAGTLIEGKVDGVASSSVCPTADGPTRSDTIAALTAATIEVIFVFVILNLHGARSIVRRNILTSGSCFYARAPVNESIAGRERPCDRSYAASLSAFYPSFSADSLNQ
ncbi:MAG: hypothetical protein ABI871_06655 [Chthoniobacterales bacterium]